MVEVEILNQLHNNVLVYVCMYLWIHVTGTCASQGPAVIRTLAPSVHNIGLPPTPLLTGHVSVTSHATVLNCLSCICIASFLSVQDRLLSKLHPQ